MYLVRQISFNKTKREIIIFRAKNKILTKHLSFRISGQKVEPCTKVKYLGVILQEHLEWNTHTNNLNTKLNRAIGLLVKIRRYVPKFLLRTLYYALFTRISYIPVKYGDKKKLWLENFFS